MIALIQRLLLLGGLCAAAWDFTYSPPQLVAARAIDAKAEYLKRYGPVPRYRFGAMGAAEALIRQETNPGSVEAYRAGLFKRTVAADPSWPAGLVADLVAAAKGGGPYAERFAKSYVYFAAGEPLFAGIAPQLRESLKKTGYLNAYCETGGRDMEFMYHAEPHSSSAPVGVLFPQRGRAWLWVAGTLGAYLLLLPLTRGSGAHHDLAALAALDLLCAFPAAFFFGLPFRVCDSTQAALDDPLGGPVWSWAVTAVLALALIGLARRAAWRLEVDGQTLKLSTLFGTQQIPLSAIARVALHEAGEGNDFSGIDIRLADGRVVAVDWTGLADFLPIFDYFRRYGVLQAKPATNLS
ncbi:MAG: hypothetical protein HY821_03540 [Acidobacteria bacterium]|nr:hypothetical protein [Acidobacteriota bacterium]